MIHCVGDRALDDPLHFWMFHFHDGQINAVVVLRGSVTVISCRPEPPTQREEGSKTYARAQRSRSARPNAIPHQPLDAPMRFPRKAFEMNECFP